MASGPPEISADKKTITVQIRHGVHFSPPVNREVTSADVAYAIDRGANPNVANPYFGGYFGSIEGAKTATGGPIPGITTPNKYTIVFHLTEPKAADSWSDALVLPRQRCRAGGIRQKVRRQETERIRQLPGGHRAVHVQGRQLRQGARHRLPAGQVGDARAQPQLEREHRLPARLPGPDQHQDRRRHQRHRTPGARRLEHGPERHAGTGDRQARV